MKNMMTLLISLYFVVSVQFVQASDANYFRYSQITIANSIGYGENSISISCNPYNFITQQEAMGGSIHGARLEFLDLNNFPAKGSTTTCQFTMTLKDAKFKVTRHITLGTAVIEIDSYQYQGKTYYAPTLLSFKSRDVRATDGFYVHNHDTPDAKGEQIKSLIIYSSAKQYGAKMWFIFQDEKSHGHDYWS